MFLAMNKEKGEFVIKTAAGSVDQKPRKKVVPKSQRNSIHLEKNVYQNRTVQEPKETHPYRIHINLDSTPHTEQKRSSVVLPTSSPRILMKPTAKDSQVTGNMTPSPNYLQKKFPATTSAHKSPLINAFQDNSKGKKQTAGFYNTIDSSQSLTELGTGPTLGQTFSNSFAAASQNQSPLYPKMAKATAVPNQPLQKKIHIQSALPGTHHLTKGGPAVKLPKPRLDGSPGTARSKEFTPIAQPGGFTKFHSSRTENSKEVGSSNTIQIKKMMHEAVRYTFKHEIVTLAGFHPDYEKSNQDNARYHQFLSNKEIVRLYILADGHGTHGREASNLATDFLISAIERGFERNNQPALSEEQLHQLINNAFDSVQSRLAEDEERRFRNSGTTMVLALIRKNVLYLTNLGDSRGFLASKSGQHLVPSLVSTEHKPDRPTEKERIEQAGGIIAQYVYKESVPTGPPRVWNKLKTEPGLATSRSFGDLVAHRLGVSHQPGNPFTQHRHSDKAT